MDFIFRRIIAGFFMGAATFLMVGFTYFLIDEKILPLYRRIYRRIMKNYEDEAYKAKKQILENVIEDEILK